jgi:hypothetical protein
MSAAREQIWENRERSLEGGMDAFYLEFDEVDECFIHFGLSLYLLEEV